MTELNDLEVNKFLEYGVDRDWLLLHLVTHANNVVDFSLPLTLWTSTGVISGVLVSGKEFVDLYIEELTAEFSEEDAAVTASKIRELASIYYEKNDSQQINEATFIHLKGAKLFAPAGVMPAEGGVLWRGKLSQVSGFNIGKLTAESGS